MRLWTIQGQFLGVFGQPDTWTHLGVLEYAPIVVKKQHQAPTQSKATTQSKLRDSMRSSVAESFGSGSGIEQG